MTQTVRTHWHTLRELAADRGQRRLYLVAPRGEKAHVASDFGYNPRQLNSLLEIAETLPKFVIDPEIPDMLKREDCLLTLQDMKEAGVLRLPFGTMIVEVPSLQKQLHPELRSYNISTIVILRDRQSTVPAPWDEQPIDEIKSDDGTLVTALPFYGQAFTLCQDEHGVYGILPAATIFCDIAEPIDGKVSPTLSVQATQAGFFDKNNPQMDSVVQATFAKTGSAVGLALFSALLIMATQGTAREVIVPARGLNKNRVAHGKAPIPRHTYIHIGRVYAAPGASRSETYEARRSPRPHWVRGFLRRYHVGPGRREEVVKLIPPQFVAWRGDEVAAELAESIAPSYAVRE